MYTDFMRFHMENRVRASIIHNDTMNNLVTFLIKPDQNYKEYIKIDRYDTFPGALPPHPNPSASVSTLHFLDVNSLNSKISV
jgi:hypothetical protein